jgi:hypothetical protein
VVTSHARFAADGSCALQWSVNGEVRRFVVDGVKMDVVVVSAGVGALSPCITVNRGSAVAWCLVGGPLHPPPSVAGSPAPLHLAATAAALQRAATLKCVEPYDDALLVAATVGHAACVQRALDKGAAVDAAGKDGNTLLHKAAFNGHEAVARMLIEAKADVNASTEVSGCVLAIVSQQTVCLCVCHLYSVWQLFAHTLLSSFCVLSPRAP